MNEANLKIPLALINNYDLSNTALLLYGELNGLYSKFHKCEITDKTLSKRLSRSNGRIQHGLKELKDAGLIISKQKPNYRGRNIVVNQKEFKQFILIPVSIVQHKDLSQNALLVYGWLNSELQKQIKINTDMHIKEPHTDTILIKQADIAKSFNKNVRQINRNIKELVEHAYIISTSQNGIGTEIVLLPIPKIKKECGKAVNGNTETRQKRVSKLDKNENPNSTKTSIQTRQKRGTNRISNRVSNKGEEVSSVSSSSNKDQRDAVDPFDPFEVGEPLKEPVYYDSIPNENDMPPQKNNDETTKDIAELNTLDIQNATQHKTSPITGKSGSESGNKYIDRSTKPTRKKYHAYNGFNLDYQVDQLRKMLNSKTGKHYPITNQRPLIEQRLKDGFTLYDFEKAIDYLVQQRRTISIRELVININNYLNKINSN
ncbi:hypothetical protein E0712_07365 [Lactobacillus helveticus]|uniref:conserved phage C-terminal domain-containing protein n=1 Tax=Lactobacillus helveticus TaxID=1587 RepID=UPI001C64C36D|nr:conserved phage C-terminal domain-containing protein [Lactobacillus helveticus]MBW8014233.1 hypothetical protein [Lactobacillus helveticus]